MATWKEAGLWTLLRGWVRATRAFWLTVGVIVLVALLVVILWKVPQLQVEKYVNVAKSDGKTMDAKDRFNIENDARKTLATILGAIVILGGAYFTWRNIRVAQEGQITDRFTKAIEQLGAVDPTGQHKKLEVRLGGIYALERVANQSERDHWPIMEVLCTYVRENAPRKPQDPTQKNQAPAAPPPHEVQESTQQTQASAEPASHQAQGSPQGTQSSAAPPDLGADIQAILTVLGRRDLRYERVTEGLDLRNTDIQGADLRGAHLGGADLSRASLSGAILIGAHLDEARLIGTDLHMALLDKADLSNAMVERADLNFASLEGANLFAAYLKSANLSFSILAWADLRAAYLGSANLEAANLLYADLSGADLEGASLEHVMGLTQEQVDAAKGNSTTRLPAGLRMPDSWKT
jgi:hypothetical protein